MKQAEDTRTGELPGLSFIETGNGAGKPRPAARGAYRGAVKLGCLGHAARARTGLSQEEFARQAGVSERSLRTWEAARDPAKEAPKVHARIVACLATMGVALPEPRPVRYRDPRTWQTWSGRGLKPRWLVVALEGGAKLSDFAC